MSLVRALTLTPVRLRFREPVRYGPHTLDSLDIGILRLVTDDGLVGLGEVAGPQAHGEVEAAIRDETATVLGHDPAGMVSGRSGVLGGALATAALDVLGQAQGRSMSDLLGGGAASVAVNGLLVLGQATPDVDARSAAELVASGCRTLKVKPAVGTGRETMTDALWAIRERLGAGVAIRLDLNGDLSERAAVDWLASLGALGLEYVEQPIAATLGIAAMARVRASIPMPLAVDESVIDEEAAARVMDEGACDVLVVKPSRVGGPMVAARIARAATAAGVLVTVSTLYDSGIGLAAALHVASTVPGDRAHGLATGSLLVSDLVGGGLQVRDWRMARPDGPGLGVTLDAQAMAMAAADARDAYADAVAGQPVFG